MNPPNEVKIMLKEFFGSTAGKLLLVGFISMIAIMIIHILHLKDDSPLEQLAELEIQSIIGIKTDLTP